MTDTRWKKIVGEDHTVNDGGYIGDLLTLARSHIDEALQNGELTASEAGQVFTALIPAAFQWGIQYDNRTLELLKIQLQTWSTTYNSGKADNLTKLISDVELEKTYDEVKA